MSRSETAPDERDSLLRQAVNEIRHLRRVNETLGAQMFVVEAFHAALLGAPRGQGMSPDLCWEIDRLLAGKKENEE